jgi:hypothetical protein
MFSFGCNQNKCYNKDDVIHWAQQITYVVKACCFVDASELGWCSTNSQSLAAFLHVV